METTIDVIERLIHVFGSLGVFGILWVEMDDVYGWTNIRKLSKRRWRKYWRKFWDDTRKYSKKKKSERNT